MNIIDVFDNCLGVNAIGLGITGVSLLSAVIRMEAVSIAMGLLWVAGNRAIKIMSLKKRETWKDCGVSCFNAYQYQ